jgi:DNA helicase IV
MYSGLFEKEAEEINPKNKKYNIIQGVSGSGKT